MGMYMDSSDGTPTNRLIRNARMLPYLRFWVNARSARERTASWRMPVCVVDMAASQDQCHG